MLRKFLAILTGVVVGVIVIGVIESVGHMIFPPPVGVNLKDPEALKSIMHEIPAAAKVAVLVAWGAGVFAGGVTARIVARGARYVSWVVAAVLFGFALMTMIEIPHPLWMVFGAAAATLIGGFAALHTPISAGKAD